MHSIKNRRKRYVTCDDVVRATGLDRLLRILTACRPQDLVLRYPTSRSLLKTVPRTVFSRFRPSQVQVLHIIEFPEASKRTLREIGAGDRT